MKYLILLIIVISSTSIAQSVTNSFFMQEKQDGKIVEDVFEIWQVSMELGTRPSIDICVASFVTNNGGTIMFLWNHKSSQLSESGDNEYQATTRSGLKNIFGA